MSIESRSRQYGKVFDHWQIREFLGSGSGGKTAVFRLVRSDSDRGASALKVVNLIEERGCLEKLSARRREEYEAVREECSASAEQEVWMMDDLRGNTNIVDYLDHTFVDWEDDTGFGRDLLIRMELLKDLRSDLRQGRQFTEAEVLKVGRDICVALILCHRKNILHRDVKPENIFLNKDGNYKLGDFGVSRVLDACPGAVASTGIGTYEYWPAEQMTGRYDTRVDTYSLGLVLYELSNKNRLPFAASAYTTSREVSQRLSGTPLPPPCDASPALAEVILTACAFSPEDRYASAEEMLKALRRVSAARRNPPSVQPRALPVEKIEEKKPEKDVTALSGGKRRRNVWVVVLILVVLAAAGAAVVMGLPGKAPTSVALPAETTEPAAVMAREEAIPLDTEESSVPETTAPAETLAQVAEETETTPTEVSETTAPETVPVETEPAATGGTEDFPLQGVVNKRYSVLNIRSGPALTEKVVGSYYSGTELEILETTQTEGIQWGRTDKGWVCMTYINLKNVEESVLYTGWVIYTDQLHARSTPSLSGYVYTDLARGENVKIYETTVAEGLVWGRTQYGWVSLSYIDMLPTTMDAVDVRVISQNNAPIYSDPNKSTWLGSYKILTLVLVYEYDDKHGELMARTDLGWVQEKDCVYDCVY